MERLNEDLAKHNDMLQKLVGEQEQRIAALEGRLNRLSDAAAHLYQVTEDLERVLADFSTYNPADSKVVARMTMLANEVKKAQSRYGSAR